MVTTMSKVASTASRRSSKMERQAPRREQQRGPQPVEGEGNEEVKGFLQDPTPACRQLSLVREY